MEELFLGTVIDFKKQRGFGNIKPDNTSDFGAKVFCHWKTLKTSDKWPALTVGMRVAFLAERDVKKAGAWKTTEVYTEDGEEISLDVEVKLLNKGKKYKGVCKSYNKGKGTGLITPDGRGPWPKTGVKVLRSDIDSDGSTPFLKKNQRVQFQLTKETDGYRAVNITLPNGGKIPTGGKPKNKPKESNKSAPKSNKSASKSKKSAPKGGVKIEKSTRKRKLSKENKSKAPPAKKRNKSKEKEPMKKAQIESGVYGGMEVDAEDTIEVGVLLKSHWVGGLIGKKGATIREIQKLSNADIKFGQEEMEVEGHMYKVFAVVGTMNQVADACKVVAMKLGEASQSLEYKIVFLIPDSYCGMFVGKKGSTINEIRGSMDLRVRVVLSQEPIQLPGSSKVTLCTLFGPRENVKDAIERTVAVLGGISARLKKQMMEPQQWGGGDNVWDGGYRNNPRESVGWGQNGRRGSEWGQAPRGGIPASRFGGRPW